MNTIKTGLLLINLGSPKAPTVKAVRSFLQEFLMDGDVVTLPWLFRALLVYGLILPFRPKKSLEAYQAIWTPDGSPLMVHSLDLLERVRLEMDDCCSVHLAMRYGDPSIKDQLKDLQSKDIERLIVLPLFPQYAKATTLTALKKVKQSCQEINYSVKLDLVEDFYAQSFFIDAQAEVMLDLYDSFRPDFTLMSYHGIPEQQINKVGCSKDHCQRKAPCPVVTSKNRYCYRAQCYATSRALALRLGLVDNYMVSFQSRLGAQAWIKPYTDQVLASLIKKGVKRLMVVCPSFVADCLETLEEIEMRLADEWKELGGEAFKMAPCVNASDLWVSGLADFIKTEFVFK